MRNHVTNTQREVEEVPLIALVHAMAGGIEASERRGQQELVRSEVLPVDARGDDARFIALGFTFGAPVEGDEIFRAATLPTGWKREGSDHAMWSHIVDERGFKRVAIFYKAAFYDRSTHMHLANVGAEVASEALYSDKPVTAESLRLALLTPDELAEFRGGLDRMRENIARSPSIYGKYADQLAVVAALL